MRDAILFIFVLAGVCFSAGCEKPLCLGVDFEQGRTLRYEFVSDRQSDIDLDPAGKMGKKSKDSIQRVSEKLEMTVAYNPIETDSSGSNVIEATYESVKVQRKTDVSKRLSGKDAVNEAQGRSYQFTISASGKMEERSELEGLIKELGEAAFRKKGKRRVKDSDMIGDFITTQWFLWDVVSSVSNPLDEISIGDEWTSKQWMALPMVMREGIDIVYRLEEIRETEEGRQAIISAELSRADEARQEWPRPYAAGSFQMSGTFGFIVGYEFQGFEGSGKYIFNIEKGILESSELRYQAKMTGRFMLPLGADPEIAIEQHITTQLK